MEKQAQMEAAKKKGDCLIYWNNIWIKIRTIK